MQQHDSIDGLVVRVRDMANHDRYLSVLTAERGRITVLSKGSHSLKGAQTAVSQLYTYGNFEFYRRGSFYILKSGSPIHPFYALSMDIDRLNLAAYLCDVTYELTDEGEEAGDMLRLLLNSLYAVSGDRYPQETVKAAFEMRAAVLSGYAPDLSGCTFCGSLEAESLYLDVMNGALVCSECLHKRARSNDGHGVYDDIREADILAPLSPASCAALRYVSEAPIERIFSFELKDTEDLRLFSAATQTYLLSHLGRGFDSLNFYHAMKQDTKD
ncbi:MAG: DNA repair protein RecO [Clostridia bacterium]|nr:DNA repair protein RecO [Clostridia bacterium]